ALAGEEGAEELEISEVGGGDDDALPLGPPLLEAPEGLLVHLHQLPGLPLREVGRPQKLDDQGSQMAVEIPEDGLPLGLALFGEGLEEVLPCNLASHPHEAEEVAEARAEEEGDR